MYAIIGREPLTLERFTELAFWAGYTEQLRLATCLWNYADSAEEPEVLWDILVDAYPEAFFDSNNVNSIKFTY